MTEAPRRALEAGERAAARYALAPPRRLLGGAGGPRLGRRAATSLEFREFRDYQPGDDLRHLDWSAYGRSDRLVVRLYREEVDPHVDLVLDTSRSMAAIESKRNAALGLAGFFLRAAEHGGFSHAGWLAGERCFRAGPPGVRPSAWGEIGFEAGGSPFGALAEAPALLRRGSLRLLISDLTWPEDPHRTLSAFGRGAAALTVVEVLSREELEPPALGPARLIDAETGHTAELDLDPATLGRYRAELARHRRAWRQACRELAVPFLEIRAEDLSREWPAGIFAELVRAEVLEAS